MSGIFPNPLQAQAVDETRRKEGDEGRENGVGKTGGEGASAMEHGLEGAADEPFGGADEADATEEPAQAIGERVEAGVDGSGADGGHSHAERTKLVGKAFSEALQVGFRGRVNGDARGRDPGGHGRKVEDASASFLLHLRSGKDAQFRHRLHMECHHGPDLREVLRSQILHEKDSGVVDKDVGRRAPRKHLFSDAMLRQVDAKGLYGNAGFRSKVCGRVGQFLLLVADDKEGISLRGQLTGEFKSHSGTCSGDEGGFLQVRHHTKIEK